MKQKRINRLLVIFVGVLFIIGVITYIYFEEFQILKEKSQLNIATPKLTPIPTIIFDKSANWKTFTNKSFTFKYPPELKVSEKNPFIIQTDTKEEYLQFHIELSTKIKNETVEDFYNRAISTYGYFGSSYIGDTMIDGRKALVFYTDHPQPSDMSLELSAKLPPLMVYVVFLDSKFSNGKEGVLRLEMRYYASSKNKIIFEQTLSTLKIID